MQEKQVITEAFTELAPHYKTAMESELFQFWGIHYHDFVEKMVAMAAVQPGEKVLDIATGTAMIPLELKTKFNAPDPIIGLDITPAMLAEGQKDIALRKPQAAIRLVCASAMTMPFANHSFHVVICGLGTHHMDVPQMLTEAKRVLRKDGRLVISDVCATPFWRTAVGRLVLYMLLRFYGIAASPVRAKAEIDAYQNVRTTSEWAKLLKDFQFGKVKMDLVTPRYPWYPGGLTLTAAASN